MTDKPLIMSAGGMASIHAAGEYRKCGVRLTHAGSRVRMNRFSDFLAGNPVMDLAVLEEYDRPIDAVPRRDQGQIGDCVLNTVATIASKARLLAGMTPQIFSPAANYALINGGADNGSDPREAFQKASRIGMFLASDVPDAWILQRDIPETAYVNALRFLLGDLDFYECRSYAEMVTADYLGFQVGTTVTVGPNFGPGPDGVVGVCPGDGNHEVSGGQAFRRLRGVPQFRLDNSWGLDWGGQEGRFWISEAHILAQPSPIMIAVRTWLSDPFDPLNPPT